MVDQKVVQAKPGQIYHRAVSHHRSGALQSSIVHRSSGMIRTLGEIARDRPRHESSDKQMLSTFRFTYSNSAALARDGSTE